MVCEGSKNAKVIDSGHDRCSMYDGSSKFGLDRTDTERLFRQLVIHGVLDEELHVTTQDYTVCYIRLGLRANDLLAGKFKVISDDLWMYYMLQLLHCVGKCAAATGTDSTGTLSLLHTCSWIAQ